MAIAKKTNPTAVRRAAFLLFSISWLSTLNYLITLNVKTHGPSDHHLLVHHLGKYDVVLVME